MQLTLLYFRLDRTSFAIAKKQLKRNVQKSTVTLLTVPPYSDPLDGQDEDETVMARGRMLINTQQRWRTEMAR